MTDEKKPSIKVGQPRIRIPRDLHTSYANLVRIAHTPGEMMFDYARYLPGDREAQVVSRVIMSPLGAKLLLKALTENITKYESAFGEIVIPQKQSLADFLFKPPDKDTDKEPDQDPEQD